MSRLSGYETALMKTLVITQLRSTADAYNVRQFGITIYMQKWFTTISGPPGVVSLLRHGYVSDIKAGLPAPIAMILEAIYLHYRTARGLHRRLGSLQAKRKGTCSHGDAFDCSRTSSRLGKQDVHNSGFLPPNTSALKRSGLVASLVRPGSESGEGYGRNVSDLTSDNSDDRDTWYRRHVTVDTPDKVTVDFFYPGAITLVRRGADAADVRASRARVQG